MTFIIPREVQDEADRAAAWCDARRAGHGTDFYDELEVTYRFIRNHPRAARRIPLRGTSAEIRRRNLRRFPYAVIYQIIPTGVMAVTVMHVKRKGNYWRRRIIP